MKNLFTNQITFLLIVISYLMTGLAKGQDIKHICKKVSPSVVMLQNEKTSGSNITCVELDEGLVFIDCGLMTDIATVFRKEMEEQFKKKTIALFLTHAHTDHYFGMGAFADVQVIASAESRKMFKAQSSIDFEANVEAYKRIFPRFDEALKTSKRFMPVFWVENELQIGNEDKHLVIRPTGGHSAGSAYALLPTEGVIIAGDNVQVDYYPYFGDKTTNMNTWIETLKKWEDLGVKHFCPGHGKFIDLAYLKQTRQYFENLVALLKKFKLEKVPIGEVLNSKDLPKGYWPEGLETPGWWNYSIASLYNKL